MKIYGLLSWYDEDSELLTKSIKAALEAGVDYLVACDGKYDSYPGEEKFSPEGNYQAIHEAVGSQEYSTWQCEVAGNEVEKRNFMLQCAWMNGAQPDDWLLVFDADHIWETTFTFRRLLELADEDFAEVAFTDSPNPDEIPGSWYEARLLNRAVHGMRYINNHYTIELPHKGISSTLRAGKSTLPALDLRDVARVRHVVDSRDFDRRSKQALYYRARHEEGFEN
jgi:hypothetical protein